MLYSLKFTRAIFGLFLLCPFSLVAQWTQLGNDIDGEFANNQSGYATSLNANGNVVAIGAPYNADNGSSSGHVRIYENTEGTWQQKGNDINGVAVSDKFGFSVSISADGNTVAVGAPDSNANGFESGQVRIFNFQETNWVQIGSAIDGESVSDHSGFSVSLSKDGSRVAIGAPDNHTIVNEGSNHGQVRVYENQGNNWVQIGGDIHGENPEDNSGYAISLSEDGSVVAIGAPNNTNTLQGAGHVRVYAYELDNWVQIGEDIDGEAVNDKFGAALSLNNQGNILAVGALDHNSTGHVKVFENLANSWEQLGSNINGEDLGDDFGISVSLNASGTVLAVGARYNSGSELEAGHTRIYRNELNSWQQIGNDIDGEAQQDRSGFSVSLNADGSVVAIGAYVNDGANGFNSGHVRLFSNTNLLNTENNSFYTQLFAYPNPTTAYLQIDLGKKVGRSKVQLCTVEGKVLYSKQLSNTDIVTIDMVTFPKGIYILKLQLDGSNKTLKVVKR